jgi:hypothetical protein
VNLKNDKRVKSQPIYDPTPYKVVSIKGTQVVIWRNGKTLARNSSLLKKVESDNNSKPMLVTIKNKKEGERVRLNRNVSTVNQNASAMWCRAIKKREELITRRDTIIS